MAEPTVSPAGPAVAAAHATAWDGTRSDGGHGERRRTRRRRAIRLLEALVPGVEPERYDVHFEYEGDQFAGVSIRERASGEEIAYLDIDTLNARGDGPGMLLERQG